MKFAQALISLTIAGLLAACGGGGGGGGNNGGDTGGGDRADNSDKWEAVTNKDGDRESFIQALYSNGKIWQHSYYSLTTGSSQLMSTDDEGETFTLHDEGRYHLIKCISDSGVFFYNEDRVDNLDFESPDPYNKKPTVSDMLTAGLTLSDLNNDGIIDDLDVPLSASHWGKSLYSASINCDSGTMFGFDYFDNERSYRDDDGVWKHKESWAIFSYDHGRTWFKSNPFAEEMTTLWSFTPTVDDAGGMYLPTKTGLVRSTNGRDWTAIALGSPITSIVNSPATNGHLLAIAGNGKLFESLNNGLHWEMVSQFSYDAGEFVSGVYPVLAVADDGEILVSIPLVTNGEVDTKMYRTLDDGSNWEELVSMNKTFIRHLFMTNGYYWATEAHKSGDIAGKKLYRLKRK